MRMMIPIKVSKLKVTVIPKVARVAELRIALEAKAMRKKITMEMKPAPVGYAATPVPVEGYPARSAPVEG